MVTADQESDMQKAAHDCYLFRFLVDDLWRDYHTFGRDVLKINLSYLTTQNERLTALLRKLADGTEPSTAKGPDCSADQ